MRTSINLGRVQVYELIFKSIQNHFKYAKGAQKVNLEKSSLNKYLSKFGLLQIENCAEHLSIQFSAKISEIMIFPNSQKISIYCFKLSNIDHLRYIWT